ncbi:MAG: hypothetical protein K2Q18_10815, partial [Bdellovibrionales bacterium]|nr:hypothetical protein [Bdellovibrionales bacterium]
FNFGIATSTPNFKYKVYVYDESGIQLNVDIANNKPAGYEDLTWHLLGLYSDRLLRKFHFIITDLTGKVLFDKVAANPCVPGGSVPSNGVLPL